eukprot:gene21429-32969_t
MQVTSISGTTRDNVDVSTLYQGTHVVLRDTPGLNASKTDRWLLRNPTTHHNPIRDEVNYWMHSKTLTACEWASVILYVFDARAGLTHLTRVQVESLLDLGRPVVLVANKWDEVVAKQETAASIEEAMRSSLEMKTLTVVCVSARNHTNTALLADTILDHYRRWHGKVGTGKLNLFWHKVQQTLHIPYNKSKARYLVQLATCPPTFAIFLSKSIILQGALARFLTNKLRREFNFNGIPIRLIQRRKPPSVFKMLGYTQPDKVYKSPPSQMAVKWKAWEKGATHANNIRMRGRTTGTKANMMTNQMGHAPYNAT